MKTREDYMTEPMVKQDRDCMERIVKMVEAGSGYDKNEGLCPITKSRFRKNCRECEFSKLPWPPPEPMVREMYRECIFDQFLFRCLKPGFAEELRAAFNKVKVDGD